MCDFDTALLLERHLPVTPAHRGWARDCSPLRTTSPLVSGHRLQRPPDDWQSAVVTSVSAASDLLDELESLGVRRREFSVVGQSLFEVRWR